MYYIFVLIDTTIAYLRYDFTTYQLYCFFSQILPFSLAYMWWWQLFRHSYKILFHSNKQYQMPFCTTHIMSYPYPSKHHQNAWMRKTVSEPSFRLLALFFPFLGGSIMVFLSSVCGHFVLLCPQIFNLTLIADLFKSPGTIACIHLTLFCAGLR